MKGGWEYYTKKHKKAIVGSVSLSIAALFIDLPVRLHRRRCGGGLFIPVKKVGKVRKRGQGTK